MFIIIGLGNIGPEYKNTRHNIGFSVLDFLADQLNTNFKNDARLHAEIAETNLDGTKLVLIKPTTYMNKSGLAVERTIRHFKADTDQIRVINDDISLPLKTLRWRASGSAGGNNGLKSIIEHIGSDFWRLKLGVDSPPPGYETKNWVLSKFSSDEQEVLESIIKTATEEILTSIENQPEEKTIHL